MSDSFDSVAIIGLGYIGLPTAALLASHKIKVTGVDINPHTVDTINRGEVHIVEPELERIVLEAVRQGWLQATTRPQPADVFLIAVPTPFKGDHQPDLACVEAACCSIAPVLKSGDLVILESTSPVGTTDKIAAWLAAARPDLIFPHQADEPAQINIAYCPERVLPGRVLQELVSNDRVIGGMTPRCSQRAIELYKIFVRADCIATAAKTAEMCKLTENAFRDVNIAFANELSLICDKLDINVRELIRLANRHPRVAILQPGPGVGGHCIAVDPWFIVSQTPDEARLIRTARQINDSKPHQVVKKITLAAAEIAEPVIACLGLTFKPDIDDLRESPALEIIQLLAAQKIGQLLTVEPHITALPAVFVGINSVELVSLDEALLRAHIVVMLVGHQIFFTIDPRQLAGKTVIDTCGVWQ